MSSRPFLVKICGLSTPETLETSIAAGADMIGLVHFARSPRHVDLARMAELATAARGGTRVVVLTVDPDDAMLEAIARAASPDFVQLHGRETPDRVAEIRRRHGIPTIKALGVATSADVDAARPYADAADLVLFDAKPPKDATRPGGLGTAFDWALLGRASMPFLLSGGLAPNNVRDAVTLVRPMGVDVSSGVESAPGVKDPALIRDFVATARSAAAEAGLAGPDEEHPGKASR